MSETAQIIGIALIFIFMMLAMYGLEIKKELGKSIWCMFVALILGVMLF
jgi:hypothetical protein